MINALRILVLFQRILLLALAPQFSAMILDASWHARPASMIRKFHVVTEDDGMPTMD